MAGLKGAILAVSALAVLVSGPVRAQEPEWDQLGARKTVALVLEMEKGGKRPWNLIPWRKSLSDAAAEARSTGKPIFLFYFTKQAGPPLEPCCPPGRLIRALSLSNSTVLSAIKRNFIPVKLALEDGQPFPLNWPALQKTATAFAFSNNRGFAGCSVISTDLEVEYGNTGSTRIWELFDSTGYDPKKFASMLERAASRNLEERALKAQRGISTLERRGEIFRFRQGVTRAVRTEGRLRLPPRGFSLEQALELFELAGAVKGTPAESKKSAQD